MRKEQLQEAVQQTKEQTGTALQLVYDSLNHGQKIKVRNNETVVQMLERFGVKL